MFSGNIGGGNSDLDFWIKHAEAEIMFTYGDIVKVKPKSIIKFGRNSDIDASNAETIMSLAGSEAHETYVSANSIDTISSSNASDTQDIRIEGHTVDGSGNFTFVVQTATLDGQNKVTLSTPLARVSRAENNGSNSLLGNVFIYEDGNITSGTPDTDSDVHIIIEAGRNQSEKAATTFSNVDYGLITSGMASINRGSTANVDIEIQIREKGGVFKPKYDFTLRTTGTNTYRFDLRPFLIVPKNADIRMVAASSAANTNVRGQFNALLALVQS